MLICICGNSQNWDAVKNSSIYYHGEGYGASIDEAKSNAIIQMLESISMNIEVEGVHKISEQEKNGNLNGESYFKKTTKTFSTAKLTNVETLVIDDEPNAHVGCWIKVAELNKMFDGRRMQIKEYLDNAQRAELKGKVDDALRYYYWGFSLTRSLQYPSKEVYVDMEGERHTTLSWVIGKMSNILDEVKVTEQSRNGDEVVLNFSYRNRPVNTIDFTYFNGSDWSNIMRARDGIATITLNEGVENYRVKVDYEGRHRANLDDELKALLKVLPGKPMANAYFNLSKSSDASSSGGLTPGVSVDAQNTKLSDTFSQLTERQTGNLSKYGQIQKMSDPGNYLAAMQRIVNSIRRRSYSAIKDEFTPEGIDIFEKLVGDYGTYRIVGNPLLTFTENRRNVFCRGLKMSFSFNTGLYRRFVEDVVFTFDKQSGKIENVSFGLGKTAETDILCKGDWPEEVRMAILQFLENYKTAYSLKRLKYIESIFADDAIIIVGNVVKKASMVNSDLGRKAIFNDIVKYNRYDKDTYLNNLRDCFDAQEYINVSFADNDIRHLKEGGQVYGVQITQDYYSTHYGDHGYLYLMIDMNDEDNPLIKVRTWQATKDYNNDELVDGLYSSSNFNITNTQK